MPAATVAESAAMASSVTVPRAPKPETPKVQPQPLPASKGKAGILVGVGVLLVLVAVAAAAGFWWWNRSRATGTIGPNVNNSNVVINAPAEIGRYWLVLEPTVANGETTRVAGLVPLASGQSFKFRFTFKEDGYVYIFGPGENNQPTAFLTTKPLPDSGVTSNRVKRGVEFSFPNGAENNITLDKNPGTDRFTIIFAKSSLPSPSFLNESVTGKPLSAAQQADLNAFVARYRQNQPITEHDESNPQAPFIRVKASPDQTDPIVFDIRIQHN